MHKRKFKYTHAKFLEEKNKARKIFAYLNEILEKKENMN